jgi:hypothetical protein
MTDEETPLLWNRGFDDDLHHQFCALTGVPASNARDKSARIGPKTLYGRATKRYAQARRAHSFMTALSNTLLLSQVVLGATLTALGASESSHILITAFGVINTVIAGLVAYLKSRGQPARQRIFRDELERVVDEIENSEIMWLGISQKIHGYSEIDIDDKVTVRGEVARLMRCYEKALRNFAMSNPDNYLMGQSEGGMALRPRGGIVQLAPAPATIPVMPPSAPVQPSAPADPVVEDLDESPASAPPKPPTPPPDSTQDNKSTKSTRSTIETSGKSVSDHASTGKDSPTDSEDAKNSAPSTQQSTQPRENLKLSITAVDPDVSPASTVHGFERLDEAHVNGERTGKS